MKQSVWELLGIISVTSGLGLLLSLFPIEIDTTLALVFLVVLGVVIAATTKGLPKMPKSSVTDFKSQFQSMVPKRSTISTMSAEQSRQVSGYSMETNLTRYFAWVEKKLSQLVVREELHCGLAGVQRGPLVITLRLRLINPSQKDLTKLMKLGPALAQLLQVEAVRIADTAQGIMVEIPSPKPVTPNGALLAKYTSGLVVAIGVDTFARPVVVNLQDHGALFWVGPSRRGKTQSMKSSLYALLRDNVGRVLFVIIASPAKVQKDWGVFAHVAGCLGIATQKQDIADVCSWLVSTMNEGRFINASKSVIVVIDDLPNILKAVPAIQQNIVDMAGMGAGLGLHLWAGTQGAGSKRTSGGTDVENNVTARILYKPATSRTGSQSAGAGGVELHQLSSAKGDAIALIDGMSTRIATAWMSDTDIALLPDGQNQKPPWQTAKKVTPPKTRQNQGQNQVTPGQTRVEPARTTQNQAEPPVTYGVQSPNVRDVSEFVPHDAEPPVKPVLEPGAEPPVNPGQTVEECIRYLATLTNDALKHENLGFDATRFPTPDEQRLIAVANNIAGSLNKTCFICYGYKNPKIINEYVKPVIQGAITEVVDVDNGPGFDGTIPDHIDLSTDQGRQLLKQMQGMGLVNLPDVSEIVEQAEDV